jgi:hypothetical protein
MTTSTERVLGSLGLLFIALIGWASEQSTGELKAVRTIRGVLGVLVMWAVTAIGWVIDRLPLPRAPRPMLTVLGKKNDSTKWFEYHSMSRSNGGL